METKRIMRGATTRRTRKYACNRGKGGRRKGRREWREGVSEQRQEGETIYMIWVRRMGQAVSAHSPSISWYQQIT